MTRLIIAIIICTFSITPAIAQNNNLPALFYVTGVASNDTLNVRSEPSASSADIGDLAYNQQRVEVLEIDPTGKWGQIRWQDGKGWVAMRFMQQLPPDPIAGHVIEKDLFCIGTEPFWSVAFLSDGRVEYFDTYPAVEHVDLLWSGIAANRPNWPIGFVAGNTGQTLTGVIDKASCSDGMSDNPFGLQVELILSKNGYVSMISGCCSLSIGN